MDTSGIRIDSEELRRINARRIELVEREISGDLSPEEQAEFEELTRIVDEIIDRHVSAICDN